MLRKLLKYDLRPSVKSWIAMGVLSVIIASVSGAFINIVRQGWLVDDTGLIIFTVLAFMALAIMVAIPYIISLYDFYRRLYTDEGYLTFTLPVTRHELLLSKLIYSMLTVSIGMVFIIIDAIFFLLMSGYMAEWSQAGTDSPFNPMTIAYIFFGLIIAVLVITAFTLFAFLMMSVASKFSKIGQSIFAIVVVYGGTLIFTPFLIVFANLSGYNSLGFADVIPQNLHQTAVLMLLSVISLFLAFVSVVFYTLEYRILHKHLNIS